MGIGLGIARALLWERVHLVVASHDPDLRAVEELKRLTEYATPIRADVSTEAGAVRMVH